MALDTIWKTLCDEWDAVKKSPRSFGAAILAVAGLISIVLWFRYDTKIDNLDSALKNLDSTLKIKDAQIAQQQGTITFQSAQLTAFRQIPASQTAAPAKSESANTTGSADIQFFADVRTAPKLISADNLWRWNYTATAIKPVDQQGKQQPDIVTGFTVFLVFDKPVNFKKMLITSSSNSLPAWSLVDSSERTAMIMFSGDISNQTILFKTAE